MRLKVSADIEKPIEKRPSSSLVAAHDVIAALPEKPSRPQADLRIYPYSISALAICHSQRLS
jgi:hypothetical protein